MREIVSATNREGVLVFCGAKLNDEQHIAFSRQLGELDDVNVLIKAGVQMRLPEHPEIFGVSNLDTKVNVMTDLDSVHMAATKGNSLWHADMAFTPRRAL